MVVVVVVGAMADEITTVGVRALAISRHGGGGIAVTIGEVRLLEIHLIPPALGEMGPAADGGEQIEQEAQDVAREDQGDDPLKDGGDVAVAGPRGADEDGGQHDLDQDEGQFHPEADAQDAVLAVVDAEPLVGRADEDGGEDVAGQEEEEEAVVQVRVVVGVEDGEQDEACGSADRGHDGEHGEDFLRPGGVGDETTRVS